MAAGAAGHCGRRVLLRVPPAAGRGRGSRGRRRWRRAAAARLHRRRVLRRRRLPGGPVLRPRHQALRHRRLRVRDASHLRRGREVLPGRLHPRGLLRGPGLSRRAVLQPRHPRLHLTVPGLHRRQPVPRRPMLHRGRVHPVLPLQRRLPRRAVLRSARQAVHQPVPLHDLQPVPERPQVLRRHLPAHVDLLPGRRLHCWPVLPRRDLRGLLPHLGRLRRRAVLRPGHPPVHLRLRLHHRGGLRRGQPML